MTPSIPLVNSEEIQNHCLTRKKEGKGTWIGQRGQGSNGDSGRAVGGSTRGGISLPAAQRSIVNCKAGRRGNTVFPSRARHIQESGFLEGEIMASWSKPSIWILALLVLSTTLLVVLIMRSC